MTSPSRTAAEVLTEHGDELATRISSSAQGAALNNLRYAAADLERAVQQREILIVMARSVGCSLREIAEATDLSPQGVSKLLARVQGDG